MRTQRITLPVLCFFLLVSLFHLVVNPKEPAFYRPEYEDLPHEIKEWLEFSKEVPLVQERIFQEKRYLLITEGLKPTGGYSIEVKEVIESQEMLIIKVASLEPGSDDFVTQAINYPYDLILLENRDLPFYFQDVHNEFKHFMGLVGLPVIHRPIVASSEWIKVFTPEPGEEVSFVIRVTGMANVHEGTVSYELLTRSGDEISSGFTTGAFLDWGYFEKEIEIPTHLTKSHIDLKLYSKSMKDGSKMFMVTIPLAFRCPNAED